MPTINFNAIIPEIIVVSFGLLIMIIDWFLPKDKKCILLYPSLIGFFLAILSSAFLWGQNESAFNRMVLTDNYSLFFNFIFLITSAITMLLSMSYIKREDINLGEYYALIMFATSGMMLMAKSNDLLLLFISLEILSFSLYILVGLMREKPHSYESALKYFLLGAFASSFLLYGIALIYGNVGSTNFGSIASAISGFPHISSLLLVALGLIIIGFSFKVALVPFHMWTPDVYEGAPTSITAFMSVGTKSATFAAFLRLFVSAFPDMYQNFGNVMWMLAILTMVLGNIVALSQTNIKRMLAYSGIAHAGYLLVALVSFSNSGIASIIFYLLAYLFTNLGAFAVVIQVGKKGEENLNIQDYAGLSKRSPFLAFAMSVFMLSLAGIPPTAGFMGKFYIFSSAVSKGYIDLAIIGVLTSVISVFFYIRVIYYMYMKDSEREISPSPYSFSMSFALIITVIGTLILGILPSYILALVKQAVF